MKILFLGGFAASQVEWIAPIIESDVETSVVYVACSIRRLARKRRTTSPPRAGMIALTPVPATYAPNMVRQRMRSCGYAARTIFVHARETATSLPSCARMPMASHFHSTAVKWLKKTPIAWKTEWITVSVSRFRP